MLYPNSYLTLPLYLRGKVKGEIMIPSQISSHSSKNEYPRISQIDLATPDILNEKLKRACKIGFFYLEIPEDCKPLIDRVIKLADSFYQQEEYKTLHLEGVSGYQAEENYQVESLRLEKSYWSKILTPELEEFAIKMEKIAVDLLKRTMTFCNIPKEDWDKATGGVTENRGQIHFTFNHYRPEKINKEGLIAHRDIGQITVLFINKKGLQAKVNDQWTEVFPIPDHFVINFGQSLELLVNNQDQLTAAWHRVPEVKEDRISFAVFTDNSPKSNLHIWDPHTPMLKDTGVTYEEYFQKSFKACFNEG